jgi:hypothetical protein
LKFGVDDTLPPGAAPITYVIPGASSRDITLAVTSYRTTEKQWEMAAKGNQDRSAVRYTELNHLVNRILQEKARPDYIIFPELSIPLRWALRIARKLAMTGVSLLAGVEYHVDRTTRTLRNDCLVSLTTNWPGYSTHIVRLQPKFAPSHEEKKRLRALNSGTRGKLFRPSGIQSRPALYVHKGFCFSVLLCSDLTNISHRDELRGEIDALFVLEWNSDIKTFASLVEATATDLHAFVVQANNREFGDSRVRSPAKIEYLRDIVQVKGGFSDYYVLGKIDYVSLRREQRGKTSKSEFKPAPIGFKMSGFRAHN